MNQYKINQNFSVKIDTKLKCFNEADQFSLLYFSDTDSKIKHNTDAIFTEILHGDEYPEKITKIVVEANIDDATITVNDASMFKIMDVIQILNNYYVISDINTNIISLKSRLIDNVSVDTDVIYSNLSGIYESFIAFSVPDTYYIIVRNNRHIHTLMSAVSIVEQTTDEKLTQIQNKNSDKTFV